MGWAVICALDFLEVSLRRAAGLFFYLIAGLMLVLAQLYTGMAFYAGEPVEMRFFALPVLLFALIPLMLALALETGNRLQAAGRLLMLAAGIGALLTLILLMTAGNPDMQAQFEPNQRIKLSWWGLLLMSLPMAAAGWFLMKAGRREVKPSALARMAARIQEGQ